MCIVFFLNKFDSVFLTVICYKGSLLCTKNAFGNHGNDYAGSHVNNLYTLASLNVSL